MAGRTVMKLDNIYVQEVFAHDFEIHICNQRKKDISNPNYFNLGFFTTEATGNTIPVGNLAIDGRIISQAKDNPAWVNLAKHELTTIYTDTNDKCGMIKTDDLTTIPNLKNAVSGIPIIRDSFRVDMKEIKEEGYFGSELYDTWHGFLGLRHDRLVYVATKCSYSEMCWILVSLGIYNAIKLDGGGSFILHNDEIIQATSENRRIHNIGTWSL